MNIETFFNGDDAQRFFFPGKIFIGNGISAKAAELLGQASSIAIIVDQVFADSSLYHCLADAGKSARVSTWITRGAPFAQDIIEFINQIGGAPDVVISIGGGSAADFAKSIILQELFGTIDGVGVGEKRGMSPRDVARRPLYIAIPTTAGSGAESSRYFVTYDKHTHGKVYGKTWQVVADWIFLDPQHLASMSDAALVSCAFDAFVHLFETFIVKHERSAFGDMFSLEGIPRIMAALERGVVRGGRDARTHEDLLFAATLAGVAISNVRTGNIHEAAGALLELTDLNHPETLFVFFRDAVEQYLGEITDREQALIPRLRLIPAFADFTRMDDVICWWEALFARVGLVERIRVSLDRLAPSQETAKAHIFQRVFTDKVWITKESPLPLDEAGISGFIDRSLARFGLAGRNRLIKPSATDYRSNQT